jgi:hypothetical protein
MEFLIYSFLIIMITILLVSSYKLFKFFTFTKMENHYEYHLVQDDDGSTYEKVIDRYETKS